MNSVGPALTSGEVLEVSVGVFAHGGIGFGAQALLGHQFAGSGLIHLETGLGFDLERQLERESVGVVR